MKCVILLVLALALVGCGGSGGGELPSGPVFVVVENGGSEPVVRVLVRDESVFPARFEWLDPSAPVLPDETSEELETVFVGPVRVGGLYADGTFSGADVVLVPGVNVVGVQ